MFEFFANIFGYLLNFINNIVGNYGLAIILFTIVIKLIMLPLSIKQQRTMKKSAKIQEKMKVIKFKYKNDQTKMNSEIMNLYKQEKMSPFSGCLSTIVQLILLMSIFYMVRFPLTYMKKIDKEQIQTYIQQMKDDGKSVNDAYAEMDILRELDYLKDKNPEDSTLDQININMKFLGLDLRKVPQQNLSDWTVYIIPILYIISTFISMRITTSMQRTKKKSDIIDITENKEGNENTKEVEKEEDMQKAMEQSTKMMSWMMPIMSVSISLVAPLGLALYWLINNLFMIGERLVLNQIIKDDE